MNNLKTKEVLMKSYDFKHDLNVNVKKLNKDAVLPCYTNDFAAGADLYSCESRTIPAGKIVTVSLGFAIEIPVGYEGQVRSRSGLARNHGIFVLNAPGTIDCDFRGEMMAILMNTSTDDYLVKKGDRVAQLIISPVLSVNFQESDELSQTTRGKKGFGSSGK